LTPLIYPRDRLKDLIANNTDGIYLPSRNVATVWSLPLHRRCSSSDRIVVYPLLRASSGPTGGQARLRENSGPQQQRAVCCPTRWHIEPFIPAWHRRQIEVSWPHAATEFSHGLHRQTIRPPPRKPLSLASPEGQQGRASSAYLSGFGAESPAGRARRRNGRRGYRRDPARCALRLDLARIPGFRRGRRHIAAAPATAPARCWIVPRVKPQLTIAADPATSTDRVASQPPPSRREGSFWVSRSRPVGGDLAGLAEHLIDVAGM
jgi:hypothetical protein